jgi:mannose-6-phosphate isomerase-like protein (cupin superfamily)
LVLLKIYKKMGDCFMLIKDIKKSDYFKAMDETFLTELLHPGHEGVAMGCSIAHAVLSPGQKSLPHKLKKSVEVYLILQGSGVMHIDEEECVVEPGQAVYIPPEAVQWIENVSGEDLKFLCVVSPPWSEDDEELCI